mgnify:CR=1 FL=1
MILNLVDLPVIKDSPGLLIILKKQISKQLIIFFKESLLRPRKDQLLETIGSIYSFKLNELTKQIELDNKQLPGDYFNTFYLELAEKNKLDVNSQKASDAAKLIAYYFRSTVNY